MAVIFRGKAVFLEHPRTGSTAMREALKKIGGQPHTRHAFVAAKQQEKTIVVVRNIYDILVSWWLIIGGGVGFENFLAGPHDGQLMVKNSQLFYYSDHADYILHYESLDRDFLMVLNTLKLPRIKLLRRNATKGKRPWQSYYTPGSRKIVQERYGEEMARYGY